MSRAAKATFAITSVLSVATVVLVHNLQADEREALRQGPIKDQERQKLKEQTKVQKARAAEYELQKELREEYSKYQDISAGPKER